jgi:hypothetical protein
MAATLANEPSPKTPIKLYRTLLGICKSFKTKYGMIAHVQSVMMVTALAA